MQESDLFLGLAEVAIVFAGFAGISVVLSSRGGGTRTRMDAARIATMVELSLSLALFSLLPLGLWGLGLSGEAVWILCSVGLAIYLAFMFMRSVRGVSQFYREDPAERDSRGWIVVSFSAPLVVIAVQCMNVFSLGLDRSSGPYVFGLILTLGIAARLFVRSISVLRRTVSESHQ